MSSCILHNICILNGDEPDDIMNIRQELEEERQQINANDLGNIIRENHQAVAKRERLMNTLEIAENI